MIGLGQRIRQIGGLLGDGRSDQQAHENQELEQADEREGHARRVGKAGMFLQKSAEPRKENGEKNGRKEDEENLGRGPKKDRRGHDGDGTEGHAQALAHDRLRTGAISRLFGRVDPVAP